MSFAVVALLMFSDLVAQQVEMQMNGAYLDIRLEMTGQPN